MTTMLSTEALWEASYQDVHERTPSMGRNLAAYSSALPQAQIESAGPRAQNQRLSVLLVGSSTFFHMKAPGSGAAATTHMLSLGIVFERFCFELGGGGPRGRILVERRNERLDHELAAAGDILRLNGTRRVDGGPSPLGEE